MASRISSPGTLALRERAKALAPVRFAEGGTMLTGLEEDEGYSAESWLDDPDFPGQKILASDLRRRNEQRAMQQQAALSQGEMEAAPQHSFVPQAVGENIVDMKAASLGGGLERRYDAAQEGTRIPVVSDFIRDVGKPAFESAWNLTPAGQAANLTGINSGQIGAQLLIPETGLDFALEAAPFAGKGVKALSMAGDALAPARGLTGAAYGAGVDPTDWLGALKRAAGEMDAAKLQGPAVVKAEKARLIAGDVVTETDELAGNIRLAKYPDDLRDTVKAWADENPDAVQDARRGVRPDADVQADARALVEEAGGDFDKLQRQWKPGEAWNAEEITAIRGTLRAKTESVLQAAETARLDNSSANHANLLIAMQDQARVQEIVHGVTAESGRALRAFRQEAADAMGSGNTAQLERLLKRIGRDKLDEAAEAIKNLNMNDPRAVMAFMRNFDKPGAWDYIHEFYINGLLSGPKTHIVNAVSNATNAILSPIERATAAGVESVLAPLQGRARERFLSEATADAFGAVSGLPEGVRAALSVLRNGFNPADMAKAEYRVQAFRGPIGRVIRAPSTLLEAMDQLGYNVNYRAALNAGAVRQGLKLGKRGQSLTDFVADALLNPNQSLIREAKETAEYRLYKGDPGKFVNNLMKLREDAPALRFVVPFLKTPANLLKYGLERSPAGFFNPRLWKNLAAKDPAASDQIARALLGSTVAASIGAGVASGKIDITAAAPSDAAARDRFFREGKVPFSIRLGDTWISFQRLEPLNQPLTQLAGAVEAMRSGEGDVVSLASRAVATIGQNFEDQTFLTGISDLLNAIEDPERSAKHYVQRMATGALPASSLLRQTAQTLDPTIRDPQGFGEAFKAVIPGMTEQVPPRLNAFGEEATRATPLSPIAISPDKQSPVDAELGRLGEEVGFVGATISGLKLSREEQQIYQEEAGQAVQLALSILFETPKYQQANDLDKSKMIERETSRARDIVREVLIDVLPAELEGVR